MALVRYVQKEMVKREKGNAYLERFEEESAELAKLEWEILEEEKLVTKW